MVALLDSGLLYVAQVTVSAGHCRAPIQNSISCKDMQTKDFTIYAKLLLGKKECIWLKG